MISWNLKGRLFQSAKPILMGIINTTPDSFYSSSRAMDTSSGLRLADKMITEGASILDIGGQSSRPGSTRISEAEEADRVLPLITDITKHFPGTIISVDTFYSGIAKKAVDAGASIVNDISGGNLDKEMLTTVAALKVPYILMHMPGNPQTMQSHTEYGDVTSVVFDYLIAGIKRCKEAGIHDIILDPGFGFGKNTVQNFRLLSNLRIFKNLDCPVLAGLSRKSTIYKTLGTVPEEALNGTTVLNTIALLNGADILRVHDVKEAGEAIKLVECYRQEE